ncbi:hypothetical protein D3C81_1339220 [compost metagenome]
MPAALENIEETVEVAVQIRLGIVQRVTHPGLRGEVNHHLWTFADKQRCDGRGIGQVNRSELEIAGLLAHPLHAVVLELRVVVGVEVVQTDH